MATEYCVGTSGWHYAHWRGKFYPEDLPARQWLSFYSQHFSTVELNSTFYRQPLEKTIISWRDAVSPGFKFAVKASRYITHIKRLRDADESIAKFMTRIQLLDDKLGPLLYQLPPGLKRDDARLESFLALLPGDTEHVIEFRHESWLEEDVYTIMRRHHAAFCIYDMPAFRTPIAVTADFAYVRFHDKVQLYGGRYSDEELSWWTREIKTLKAERVYAYFNNDADGFAIENALTLKHMLEAGIKSR